MKIKGRKTTYSCVTINSAILLASIPETEHGGNEGYSVADKNVPFEHLLQFLRVPATEDNKVDIHGHASSPHRVRLHEPVRKVRQR